jgi:hypothetical protein
LTSFTPIAKTSNYRAFSESPSSHFLSSFRNAPFKLIDEPCQ